MTNDTFTELSDDQLRRAIREIAGWAEPSVATDPSERPPIALVPLDRVERRRWSQPVVRVAAAAAAVVIVVAAAVFAIDRSDPPVADEPARQGVIDRLPDGLTNLGVVDLEALRAVESPTEEVTSMLGMAELDVAALLPDPSDELGLDVDSVTVVARSSNAPLGLAYDPSLPVPQHVRILATSEDPSMVGAALEEAGFEAIGDGHYQRALWAEATFDSRGFQMAARVEPGYLTVAWRTVEGPEGVDLLPMPAGPSAALAAVLEAGSDDYVLSGRVDASVAGLDCGAVEAVAFGPEGPRLIVVTGADGTVRNDLEPELNGFGVTGPPRRDGDITTVDIELGPAGVSVVRGLFTPDWGSSVDC
jgi:hypothetical protein